LAETGGGSCPSKKGKPTSPKKTPGGGYYLRVLAHQRGWKGIRNEKKKEVTFMNIEEEGTQEEEDIMP